VLGGGLDLFLWLSYRGFTAKSEERVPLFAAFGLVSQLGSAPYARPRKFREGWNSGWIWCEGCGPNVRPASVEMATY